MSAMEVLSMSEIKISLTSKKFCCEFGIKEKDFVVGHIGKFMDAKNHEFLLDVFKNISEKNKAHLIKEAYRPQLDYLKVVDEVYFEGE